MIRTSFLLALVAAFPTSTLAGPAVEVATLDGRTVIGEFVSLSKSELVVRTATGDETLSVDDLLDVAYPEAEGRTGIDREKARVSLSDGTRIDANSVTVGARGAVVDGVRTGKVEIPARALANIRFPGAEEKFDATWTELANRTSTSDVLVIRKTEVLDHLKGIVGDVTTEAVRFEIGGNEIPVSLEKAYGIVYGGKAVASKPSCLATLHGADTLALASIALDGDAYVGTLAAGGDVTIPADEVRSLDFSIGKVRYLSKVDPERVEYVSYWPDEAHRAWIAYRRDRNQDGDPLRIGKQVFSRGLWLHSKTTIRYRLASEFRTFKAVMGMDSIAARRNRGNDVRVVIRGDDEVLLDQHVASGDEPTELALDVDGVNFLEILVDFGKDGHDTLDHLALGDARVLK